MALPHIRFILADCTGAMLLRLSRRHYVHQIAEVFMWIAVDVSACVTRPCCLRFWLGQCMGQGRVEPASTLGYDRSSGSSGTFSALVFLFLPVLSMCAASFLWSVREFSASREGVFVSCSGVGRGGHLCGCMYEPLGGGGTCLLSRAIGMAADFRSL